METKGRIFNIQHFSVHDGPGIRTAVFLKGCPLRCCWCSNPESQNFFPEPAWSKTKCIGCVGCVRSLGCRFDDSGIKWKQPFHFTKSEVEKICPGGALHIIGEEKTAGEVIDICERDKPFFGCDGGITITGGEPLAQPEFALDILRKAKARGIHTAIESCGYVKKDTVIEAAKWIDYYIMDVKCIEEELHRSGTGHSNKKIIENLIELERNYPKKPLLIRTPVIPNFNDNKEELSKIAEFINIINQGNIRWELLKYHRLGYSKYESLGLEYPMGQIRLSEDHFKRLKKAAYSVLKPKK